MTRLACILVAGLCLSVSAQTRTLQPELAGMRFGFSGHQHDQRFHQTEAFADLTLPWHFDLGDTWALDPFIDVSAGWLGGRGEDAFVGTLGPSLRLGPEGLPVALVGGISPTILSEDQFGDKNLGIPFQFTSHLGLQLTVKSRFELGYRFQHLSNAGLGTTNPGLNLHVFTVGCHF